MNAPAARVPRDGPAEDGAPRARLTPSAWIGLLILVFWLAVALLGPAFAPHGETEI